MMKREEPVVKADSDKRLDKWFKDRFPALPFGKLQKMMRTGEIRLNGGRVKGAERLSEGDLIRVPPISDKPVSSGVYAGTQSGSFWEMKDEIVREVKNWVLYQDNDLLVINKPPGLATQGGSGQGHKHLDAYLDAFDRVDDMRPRLVHRLDKDTSGAILVARTRKSAAFLAKAFQSRSTDKRYLALTVGVPDPREGEIRLKMEKVPGPHGEKMMVDDINGKSSRTLFKVLDYAGKTAALVALKPLTGRTHQLRLHLSTIGTPIAGDGKYAGPEGQLTGGISRKLHLHSRSITFEHPNGSEITVKAPLPAHMADSIASLGFDLDEKSDPFAEDDLT